MVFKKGEISNPHGRKISTPEILEARKYTKLHVEEVFRKIIAMTLMEVRRMGKDSYSPMLNRLLCKIVLKGYDEADVRCADFMLDRIMGKVKEASPIMIEMPMTQIVEKSPEQIAAEKDSQAVIYEVMMSEAGKFRYPRPRLISTDSEDKDKKH